MMRRYIADRAPRVFINPAACARSRPGFHPLLKNPGAVSGPIVKSHSGASRSIASSATSGRLMVRTDFLVFGGPISGR